MGIFREYFREKCAGRASGGISIVVNDFEDCVSGRLLLPGTQALT